MTTHDAVQRRTTATNPDVSDPDTPRMSVLIPTWSRATTLKVWAAAAIPMAILAWVAAPLLARTLSGPTALPRALILSLATGLIWQFVLVLIVVRREQGSLRWPVVKAALWLNGPLSPRTGTSRKRLWWLVVPLMVLLALEEMLPSIPSPVSRDNAQFFSSDTGQEWMSGNWVWFAILIVLFIFNTALGEELFFRGLLLPRMRAFGRRDWLANGVLFACYHLHEPWVIPQTLLVDTFAEALPARRYRSSLISIAVHSSQTVFFFAIALALVFR